MSAPTELRLVADNLYHRIMLEDGRPCACVAGGGHQKPFSPAEFEAIRRRLVACWNACEAIDTEKLEKKPGIVAQALDEAAGFMNAIVEQRDALQAERDALLNALVQIKDLRPIGSGASEYAITIESIALTAISAAQPTTSEAQP